MGLFTRIIPTLLLMYTIVIADQYTSSYNDILPAITWASLDLGQVSRPDPLTSWESMVTWDDLANYNETSTRRRKRTLTLKPDGDASFVMEVKLVIPLWTISDDAKVQLELPIGYNLGSPFRGREGGEWDLELGDMAHRLEDMVEMLGLDGETCVQRAVCELASSPSLQPQGLVGEMIQIFVRRILEVSPGNDTGEYSQAGIYGRREGDCLQRYSKCSHSLFSLSS